MRRTLPLVAAVAASGTWDCSTGRWEPRVDVAAARACAVLQRYDEVVFAGDSLTRNLYQGLLLLVQGLTADHGADRDQIAGGSLWSSYLGKHEWQWQQPTHHRWWGSTAPLNKTSERGRACANGPDDQYTKIPCRLAIITDTFGVDRVCGGRVTARFWWAWDAVEAGYAKLRTTVIAGFPLMGRSLLVTGHGLHAKHGAPYPALAGEWLRPLVAAAGGRRVDVVYHTVDAPGSRKPDQYVMTQGEARIALVNRGQSEQLHGWANTSTFPANVTFLVADWFNLTHHANGCRHLRSFDGTHYGHVVNTEKARQLVRSLELLPR